MNIEMIFRKFRDEDSYFKMIYGVNIKIKNEDKYESVFIDTSSMLDPGTAWIDINKLNNEDFLKEHGINYILEGEDKNIIPVGLIDFTNPREYSFIELNIWNRKHTDLHKCNQIIKNIERAIRIKYEAVKFINRFDRYDSPKVECISLD